jgi:hypothetical protein
MKNFIVVIVYLIIYHVTSAVFKCKFNIFSEGFNVKNLVIDVLIFSCSYVLVSICMRGLRLGIRR